MKYDEYVQEKTEITKSWLQQTLLRSSKSVAALADAMGFRSESSLYKAANPMESHRFHLENLPILIHETGDFAILDQIEALFGRVAFVMPQAQGGLREIVEAQAKAIKEFSDYLSKVAEAVQDGQVSAAEMADIEVECAEAMSQLSVLMETVRLMQRRSGPLQAFGS